MARRKNNWIVMIGLVLVFVMIASIVFASGENSGGSSEGEDESELLGTPKISIDGDTLKIEPAEDVYTGFYIYVNGSYTNTTSKLSVDLVTLLEGKYGTTFKIKVRAYASNGAMSNYSNIVTYGEESETTSTVSTTIDPPQISIKGTTLTVYAVEGAEAYQIWTLQGEAGSNCSDTFSIDGESVQVDISELLFDGVNDVWVVVSNGIKRVSSETLQVEYPLPVYKAPTIVIANDVLTITPQDESVEVEAWNIYAEGTLLESIAGNKFSYAIGETLAIFGVDALTCTVTVTGTVNGVETEESNEVTYEYAANIAPSITLDGSTLNITLGSIGAGPRGVVLVEAVDYASVAITECKNTMTFSLDNLIDDAGTYVIRCYVWATNDHSIYSNEVTYTLVTTAAPTFNFTYNKGQMVLLLHSPKDNGEYEVYLDDEYAFKFATDQAINYVESYMPDLMPGEYSIKIRHIGADGDISAFSESITFFIEPRISLSETILTIYEVKNATGYSIWQSNGEDGDDEEVLILENIDGSAEIDVKEYLNDGLNTLYVTAWNGSGYSDSSEELIFNYVSGKVYYHMPPSISVTDEGILQIVPHDADVPVTMWYVYVNGDNIGAVTGTTYTFDLDTAMNRKSFDAGTYSIGVAAYASLFETDATTIEYEFEPSLTAPSISLDGNILSISPNGVVEAEQWRIYLDGELYDTADASCREIALATENELEKGTYFVHVTAVAGDLESKFSTTAFFRYMEPSAPLISVSDGTLTITPQGAVEAEQWRIYANGELVATLDGSYLSYYLFPADNEMPSGTYTITVTGSAYGFESEASSAITYEYVNTNVEEETVNLIVSASDYRDLRYLLNGTESDMSNNSVYDGTVGEIVASGSDYHVPKGCWVLIYFSSSDYFIDEYDGCTIEQFTDYIIVSDIEDDAWVIVGIN